MKRHFSEKLVMTKEGNEDFENSNVGSAVMIILIQMLK